MRDATLFLLLLFLASCSYQQFPASPCHRINYDSINTFDTQTSINLAGITKGKTFNTGSMLPVINGNSTILYNQIAGENNLCIGDIIMYNETSAGCYNKYSDLALHRIIKKGADEKGTYFITKGDNNNIADDCKVRINDIRVVVVGILY